MKRNDALTHIEIIGKLARAASMPDFENEIHTITQIVKRNSNTDESKTHLVNRLRIISSWAKASGEYELFEAVSYFQGLVISKNNNQEIQKWIEIPSKIN